MCGTRGDEVRQPGISLICPGGLAHSAPPQRPSTRHPGERDDSVSESGHAVAVARVLDDFAAARPSDVIRRGGDTVVAVEAAQDLIDEAERRGVKVLGLDGFLVSEDAVYPALSRIADFSRCSATEAEDRARSLLTGEWASPPTAADQMHSEASGRYMVDIVLDD